MISSKKILLCGIEKENIDKLMEWRNRPELRKYFREYRELTKSMQEDWYERIMKDKGQVNFEIHENVSENKRLIGHCGLYYIDFIIRSAEFGIYIGEDDYRGGGFGSDALRTLVKYGFDTLNLNKIWCEVYDNNDALSVYKHIGFVCEGRMRDNYYDEGRYWDSHILSMLKKDYLNAQME